MNRNRYCLNKGTKQGYFGLKRFLFKCLKNFLKNLSKKFGESHLFVLPLRPLSEKGVV